MSYVCPIHGKLARDYIGNARIKEYPTRDRCIEVWQMRKVCRVDKCGKDLSWVEQDKNELRDEVQIPET